MDIQYHECAELKKAIDAGVYVRLAGGGLGQYKGQGAETPLTKQMRDELRISSNRKTLTVIERCPFCQKPNKRRLS